MSLKNQVSITYYYELFKSIIEKKLLNRFPGPGSEVSAKDAEI